MSEYVKAMIKNQADKIRAKAEGGRLCGEPIDISDIDQLILAAYLIGTLDNNPSFWDGKPARREIWVRTE